MLGNTTINVKEVFAAKQVGLQINGKTKYRAHATTERKDMIRQYVIMDRYNFERVNQFWEVQLPHIDDIAQEISNRM